tara:strand:+ start:983 stop:1882 length:900 start_codon:yes stop_codon:yes gene_type:complete
MTCPDPIKMACRCLILMIVIQGSPAPAESNDFPIEARRLPGVERLVEFDEGMLCGSQPETVQALDALKRLGVGTIICVDGVPPEVAAIEARDMSVMHIPLGYGEVTARQRLQLAAALHQAGSESKVYIHCHHGYHRSGAAAAIASVATGRLTASEAIDRMKRSGTSPDYKGLWTSVDATVRLKPEVIASVPPPPASIAPLGMVESMIRADDLMDRLDPQDPASWSIRDAALLADLFRQLQQDSSIETHGARFASQMDDSWKRAVELETGIEDRLDPERLLLIRHRLAASCKACHASHRN